MPPSTGPYSLPLLVLLRRALGSYILLRALLVVVEAILSLMAGPGAEVALLNPLGVLLLSAALGRVDIVRRGERIFWDNLGLRAHTAPAVFGAVAIVGELLLMALRP